MLSTVLYYELAMKVPIPVGITVYLLTWGLGHLRCLVYHGSSLTYSGADLGGGRYSIFEVRDSSILD